MKRVTENVQVGANICNHSLVTTKDGVVLIDTPAVPSAAAAWRSAIAPYGPIRYLINTEPHIDHFGGDYFFDAPLVTQEGARRIIEGTSREGLTQMLSSWPGERLPDSFSFRLPTITFSENLTLYVGDHTFRLLHMPGHTPFQSPVYVPEERVLFAGDNVVNGMPLFHEAVPEQWLLSLDGLMELEIDVVVPGHGEVGDKGLIARMKAETAACMDIVGEAIAKGLTLEEVLATVSFLDRYPEPGADKAKRAYFQNMSLARLYRALKKG
jgi:cyclase